MKYSFFILQRSCITIVIYFCFRIIIIIIIIIIVDVVVVIISQSQILFCWNVLPLILCQFVTVVSKMVLNTDIFKSIVLKLEILVSRQH